MLRLLTLILSAFFIFYSATSGGQGCSKSVTSFPDTTRKDKRRSYIHPQRNMGMMYTFQASTHTEGCTRRRYSNSIRGGHNECRSPSRTENCTRRAHRPTRLPEGMMHVFRTMFQCSCTPIRFGAQKKRPTKCIFEDHIMKKKEYLTL